MTWPRRDPTTRHLDVAAGERVVWTRTAHLRWIVPAVTGIGTLAAIIAIALGATEALAWIAVAYVLSLTVVILFSSARVTVDATGLTVRRGPGIRARTVAAREIAAFDVIDINPLRDFGGWGVRAARGGVGIVLRSGPGIRTTTADGRRFAVTVDDAETGAAVLAGIALRAQGSGA